MTADEPHVGSDAPALADQAVSVLRDAGVSLEPGLSADELAQVEARYGIRFGDDHRALLTRAVPTGRNLPDWRSDDPDELRRRIAWPHDSAVWHVQHEVKDWPRSWGLRPDNPEDLEALARRHLARWHPLIPLWGHRYLPAHPAPPRSPVFSVYQIDVVRYGVDLLDYLHHELNRRAYTPPRRDAEHIYYPWSQLAQDIEPADLQPPPGTSPGPPRAT